MDFFNKGRIQTCVSFSIIKHANLDIIDFVEVYQVDFFSRCHPISLFFPLHQHEYCFWVVFRGCDEQMLCCWAHSDLGFSVVSSTVSLDGQCCVIMERRHGWKQQENKVHLSLSLSLSQRSSSACPCLSVHLSVSIKLSVFLSALSLSPSLSHSSISLSTFRVQHANMQMQILSPGLGLKCYAMPLYLMSSSFQLLNVLVLLY